MSSRNQSPHQESNQETKFMANLRIPLGYKYRFAPEDHELITYLSCKVNGEPLPFEGVIKEADLYSMSNPGKLFQGSREKIVYIFTKVNKVAENGKWMERKVTGTRMWKEVDNGQPIYDREGRIVGEKKNFNFMNKMNVKLGYNMTEFVLDKGNLSAAKFKDYVLCQIEKKVKKGRRAREAVTGWYSKPAVEEERNAAIEEEVNSYSTLDPMPENSLILLNSAVSSQHCKKEPVVSKLPQWLLSSKP